MYFSILFLLLFCVDEGTSEYTVQGADLTYCIVAYRDTGGQMLSVRSAVPLTWLQMQQLCWTEHPGYWISLQTDNFPDYIRPMCPAGSLVPLGVLREDGELRWNGVKGRRPKVTPADFELLKNPGTDISGDWGALRWPNSELVVVGNETKFTCGICKVAERGDAITKPVYPAHNNSEYAYDLELVSNHKIDDLSLVANGSVLANKLLDNLAKAFNISVTSLRWHGVTLNEDRKAVVHVYYDRGDVDMDWLDYVHWYDPNLERKEVDDFELTMIKLNTECPPTRSTNQRNVRNKALLTGFLNTTLNTDTLQLTTSECFWNSTPGVESAAWSAPIKWDMVWGKCYEGVSLLPQLLSLKGAEFAVSLKNVDIHSEIALAPRNRVPFLNSMHDFQKLVSIANVLLVMHTRVNTTGTAFAILSNSQALYLSKVYVELPMDPGRKTALVHTRFVNLLSTELIAENPVVGLALSLAGDPSEEAPPVTQLNRSDVVSSLKDSHIVVTVSESISSSATRLAIATYAAHLDWPNFTYIYDDSFDSWMALVQVSFFRSEISEVASKNDFVDIAFMPAFRVTTMRGKCAQRLFATDEWYGDNCRILKSSRAALQVCRCENLPQDGDFTSGTYIVYGSDSSLSTFISNNLTLVVVIVFVSVMSALGLASVIATALFFPEWRKDQGHQIFLQMVLALAVNLALGFVNNFINIDTKSFACIAIGVVRHYSFLAMFFWMMILSGLQVKRLMTIAGAKATTHLILKVSAIAWGLPLVPIVILLSWDTGFYKSEVSNRGYCYPEGVAFQATVQGPAALILFLNLVVFVIILNHIYGWVKCNKDVDVRKHTSDDRAAQLRNFGNSVFVFFLFGFTWLFHFLSEEGIINSEFLFEFMFIITASFHLFMLALFFIVFDQKTRTLWVDAITGHQGRPKIAGFSWFKRRGLRRKENDQKK